MMSHRRFLLLLPVIIAGLVLRDAVSIKTTTSFLTVDKTSNRLSFQGHPVFLSGANQPWIQYGADFGNNQSPAIRCELQSYLKNVSSAGGNVVRMWIFVEGDSIPKFNASGFVVGTDDTDTLVNDLKQYLRYAGSQGVFVILTLWNGALMRNENVKNLFTDTSKLDSFFENALIPLVNGLKDEPALAAYEIMNEPEGSVRIESNAEPCFDTQRVLGGSGAGWAGESVSMQNLLRFHGKHSRIIHENDPKALVTVGAWSQYSSTDSTSLPDSGRRFFNYYKDECLTKANGGESEGVLDFYQIHTYAGGDGRFAPSSPMSVNASALELDKPTVIGEFSAKKCAKTDCTIETLYEHAFESYSGCLDWSLLGGDGNDDASVAAKGMAALQSETSITSAANALRREVQPPVDTCSCSDVPPDSRYTCAQQAAFGKCGESWMKGFCCRSCFGCASSCSSVHIVDRIGETVDAWTMQKRMGLGINLGNTLDAPSEGNWAPAAKESFFEQYRSKNFTNVRIPVQWGHHFVESDENFTVSSDFMDRVEQVVDWSLTYGFVTIVNVHHDEWFENGYPSSLPKFEALWTQIATRFANKSQDLLFEIYNEPHASSFDAEDLNEMSRKVYKIVRSTNGPSRIVIFGGLKYMNPSWILQNPDAMTIFDNEAQGDPYTMLEIHNYDPYNYAGANPTVFEWGSDEDVKAMEEWMDQIGNWSTSKNVPIYYGEFGCSTAQNEATGRYTWYRKHADAIRSHGFGSSVWDDDGKFRVFDRNANAWDEKLVDALMPS